MKFIHYSGPKHRFKKGQRIDYKKSKIDLKTPAISSASINLLPLKIIFVGLVLVGFYYWLFMSGFFNIKEIVIDGDAGDEIKTEVTSLRGQNIFRVGGKDTETSLQQKKPGIKKIKIIRGIPNTLKVELYERDSALTWESQGKKYLVDATGVPFKETDKTKHFLIIDTNNLPVALGTRVVDEDFIIFVEFAEQEIPLKTDFKIDHFEILETTYQIIVVGENKKKIFFSTMRQLMPQLQAFKKIYDEKKDEIQEYLDTRVEGLVYYK